MTTKIVSILVLMAGTVLQNMEKKNGNGNRVSILVLMAGTVLPEENLEFRFRDFLFQSLF